MNALIYIFRTSFKNKVKKSLKKPLTYIYLVFFVAYIGFMISSLSGFITGFDFSNPAGFVSTVTLMNVWSIPISLASYAKRKGVNFRTQDVHFVFPSPINPKLILLYGQIKAQIASIFINLILAIMGVLTYGISIWKMLIYIIFACVIEVILESSLMIILYGNETIPGYVIKIISYCLYGILISLVLLILYLLKANGLTTAVVSIFLNHPFLQCIPIIGWNISVVRILILGPTTLTIVNVILYCIAVVVLSIAAKKMKCTGEYFEEAMKFADDYQEILQKSKSGNSSITLVGSKKKYKKANVEYKGIYGKSIFYRQLLEYKKERFFIFGGKTLIDIAVGVGLAFMAVSIDDGLETIGMFLPVIGGVYITFFSSGYLTKWEKELKNPYTFLIPDSPFRKMWYATLIEHIRAFISGTIITLPTAILLKISPVISVLSILIYVCLQANKVYINILVEFILGNLLGNIGKSVLKAIMQGTTIVVGIIAVVLGISIGGIEAGFIALIICVILFTTLIAIGGSYSFAKMEMLE